MPDASKKFRAWEMYQGHPPIRPNYTLVVRDIIAPSDSTFLWPQHLVQASIYFTDTWFACILLNTVI